MADSSGAAVPDVEVTIRQLETGTTRSVRTNESGLYAAPSLSIGSYQVTAEKEGFRTATSPEFQLATGQQARMDLTLTPSTVSESILVEATAPVLDTDTSTVGQVINNKTIVNLPLNGRNYLELARLTTGTGPAIGSRPGQEGAFAASGQHSWQVNIQVDGMDNNSRESGGALGYEAQAVRPSVDSVAEFRVVTNNLSAEHGFRMGGTVFVTLKSGTNQFHGSAFEFLRNSKLDATNFFANRNGAPKPLFKRNQFGATLGGPIVRDRIFIFGSYEGTRVRRGQSYVSTVPTADIREGDFSRVRPIFDPLTTQGTGGNMTRQQFPGNLIPKSRWDPLFPKLLALYPSAMDESKVVNNYFFSPSDKDRNDSYDVKADHNLTQLSRLSFRYSLRDVAREEPGPLPMPADGGLWTITDLRSQNLVLTHTHTFTPSLTNEARFGFSRIKSVFDIPYDKPLFDEFGITGIPVTNRETSNNHGLTRFTPAGNAELGSRSFWPNFNDLDYFQFSDILFKTAGRHTFKMGGDFRQERMYRDAARYARGQMAFNREFTADPKNRANTGDGLAEFMLGLAAGGTLGNENGEYLHANSLDLFFQDDWKITNRLTLNLGVRYDIFFGSTFPEGGVSSFLLDFNNTGPNARLAQRRPEGPDDCGCTQDWNNIAPRVGFAYQATSKTVVRSGFGMIYGQADTLRKHSGRFQAQSPDNVEYNFSTLDRINPQFTLSGGFPKVAIPTTEVPGPALVGVSDRPEEIPTQYSMQWFFDIQRELPWQLVTTIGYQGSGARKLASGLNYNLPEGPSATPVAQRRRWPYYTGVSTLLFDGTMNYNALTFRAEKRFSDGLQFLSAYTWSKNLDNVVEDNNEVGGQGSVNPYNRRLQRGRSVNDINHNWTFSSVYELPLGRGKQWLNSGGITNWVLGGWQAGAILSLHSGAPFTVVTSGNVTNAGGADRPNRIGSGELPASERSIDRWFDTSAFGLQPQYTYGNSGRNILSGPGTRNLDVSLAKNFPIRETWDLQFRAEAFNVTNTSSFGQPNATLNGLGVATINSAGDPRRLQFGLKLLW